MTIASSNLLDRIVDKMGIGTSALPVDPVTAFKVVNIDEAGRKSFRAKIKIEDSHIRLYRVRLDQD